MVHCKREERAEGCETTGCDGKTLFDGRPDRDVESIP